MILGGARTESGAQLRALEQARGRKRGGCGWVRLFPISPFIWSVHLLRQQSALSAFSRQQWHPSRHATPNNKHQTTPPTPGCTGHASGGHWSKPAACSIPSRITMALFTFLFNYYVLRWHGAFKRRENSENGASPERASEGRGRSTPSPPLPVLPRFFFILRIFFSLSSSYFYHGHMFHSLLSYFCCSLFSWLSCFCYYHFFHLLLLYFYHFNFCSTFFHGCCHHVLNHHPFCFFSVEIIVCLQDYHPVEYEGFVGSIFGT